MTTREPPAATRADAMTKVRFLRPSEQVALTVDPRDRSTIHRALDRLLPGADERPRRLPNRVLGLTAAGFPAAVPPIDPVKGIEPLENLHVVLIGKGLWHHYDKVPVLHSEVFWDGDGPQSVTEEVDGPFRWDLPPPDEGDVMPQGQNVIYQALVVGGCKALPFPITLNSWIVEKASGKEIGSVTLSDPTTLDHPGLYDFWYELEANGTNTGKSRFEISGSVLVQCTNIATLNTLGD